MKTKKINTKLSLSKRTIANLNGSEMKAVKGRGWTASCIICETDACPTVGSCYCVTLTACTNTEACTDTCGCPIETEETCGCDSLTVCTC